MSVSLIVVAAHAGASSSCHGVDLIDEDDARRMFFPSSNRSRTREAPTPTNISTKSDPEMLKNGTPASPATAFARRVLPVPGGTQEELLSGFSRRPVYISPVLSGNRPPQQGLLFPLLSPQHRGTGLFVFVGGHMGVAFSKIHHFVSAASTAAHGAVHHRHAKRRIIPSSRVGRTDVMKMLSLWTFCTVYVTSASSRRLIAAFTSVTLTV